MSKTMKIVLGVVGAMVAAVALFLLVVAMQPSTFSVTRAITINAPPDAVFPKVNDFHNWQAWSPWAKLDPTAKNYFEGPESGKDSVFSWVGNDNVGEGKMTIVDSQPSELVKIKLEFLKPFASTADTLITFKPESEGTQVNWTMSGENNFIGKAICMFMDMDKMVGRDFENGLKAMKAEVEQPPKGTAEQPKNTAEQPPKSEAEPPKNEAEQPPATPQP